MNRERKTKKTILGDVILFVVFVILMLKGITCGVDWNHVNEAEQRLDNYCEERGNQQYEARRDIEKKCIDLQTVP